MRYGSLVVCFKQKTAYEMRISDWSSDVCASDLLRLGDWLVAHGPVAPALPEHPELSEVPVLDANGLPYVAQPPQPLLNGQQGVPEAPTAIAWEIDRKSVV